MPTNQEVLNKELTTRLQLQISLSSLPFVEEWMDTHLTRWLEGVPMPTEMPIGHHATFLVGFASDLSRLTWTAHGHPDGYVPKLIDFLQRESVPKADIELLESLGSRLDPKLVGSWIEVVDEKIARGWQFYGSQSFSLIEGALADSGGAAILNDWLRDMKITTFDRFVQGVGDSASTEIEFRIPGVSIDDQMARLREGFTSIAGAPLPDCIVRDFAEASEPAFAVSVRFVDGTVERVRAIAPSVGRDVLAATCRDLSLEFSEGLANLMNALQSGSIERAAYFWSLHGEGVDLFLTPGTGGEKQGQATAAN